VEEGQRYAVDSIMFLVGNKADVSEERVTEAAKAEVRSPSSSSSSLLLPRQERALTRESCAQPLHTAFLQEYAKDEEIAFYMETSAKTGNNVDALFLAVAKKLEGRCELSFHPSIHPFILHHHLLLLLHVFVFSPSSTSSTPSSSPFFIHSFNPDEEEADNGKKGKKGKKDDGKVDIKSTDKKKPGGKKCTI